MCVCSAAILLAQALVARTPLVFPTLYSAMAPHLTPEELDEIREMAAARVEPTAIHKQLAARRQQAGLEPPNLTTVRRAFRGQTHLRGRPETRGRKRKLTPANVRRLNAVRRDLVKKARTEHEVHWDDVISKARVPAIAPCTAKAYLREAGVDIAWRKLRQKPLRDAAAIAERASVCNRWRRFPKHFFSKDLDMIIDNKHFDVPRSARARRYAKMRRVRGVLRTRAEGIEAGFTQPSGEKKHRVAPGASVLVCAGIVNNKVKVWHYLDKRWCADAADKLYRNVLFKALRRNRGVKPTYTLLEDNDRTGYKCKKAIAAKKELGIKPIAFPRYSPDLNPLDFFLWSEVLRKMDQQPTRKNESKDAYLARLRRTAMSIPASVIRRAVESIKARAAAVVKAKGEDIARD